MFDLKLSGIDEVLTATQKATRRYVDAFEAAVFVAAGNILTELTPGVPFKTGELRDSDFVTRTMPVDAGFSAGHAAAAHEVGPQKKFLQRPMSAAASTTTKRIAALVPGFAERGVTLATAPATHPEHPGTARARRRPQARR